MVELTCESVLSWTFILGGVLKLLILFHYWSLISSYFLFLASLVLGDCKFLRICPFFLGFPFYWCIVNCTSLLFYTVFLSYLLHLLLFHFWFYSFVVSLFFLGACSWRCVSLVCLFNKPALSFINLFYSFFSLYFINFVIYSLFLLTLGFVCSFL